MVPGANVPVEATRRTLQATACYRRQAQRHLGDTPDTPGRSSGTSRTCPDSRSRRDAPARDHARRIVGAIPAAQRAAIAKNPIAGIESLGYTVVAEPALTSQRGAGGWCDGLSFAEHNTVMYAPTPGSKKENFTLLHEVAHILVENDDDALIWLADRDDPDVETRAALRGDRRRPRRSGRHARRGRRNGPATGEDLKTLVARSAASGPACAIALSSRLSSGAVVIIDRPRRASSTRRFAATTSRCTRGKAHERACRTSAAQPRTGLRHDQDGVLGRQWERRQEYYVNAVATEKRIYAIFSVTDLWGVDQFHGGQEPPEKSNAPRLTIRCACGYFGKAFGWPCDTCKRQFCPKCGECDCARRASAAAAVQQLLLQRSCGRPRRRGLQQLSMNKPAGRAEPPYTGPCALICQ